MVNIVCEVVAGAMSPTLSEPPNVSMQRQTSGMETMDFESLSVRVLFHKHTNSPQLYWYLTIMEIYDLDVHPYSQWLGQLRFLQLIDQVWVHLPTHSKKVGFNWSPVYRLMEHKVVPCIRYQRCFGLGYRSQVELRPYTSILSHSQTDTLLLQSSGIQGKAKLYSPKDHNFAFK